MADLWDEAQKCRIVGTHQKVQDVQDVQLNAGDDMRRGEIGESAIRWSSVSSPTIQRASDHIARRPRHG